MEVIAGETYFIEAVPRENSERNGELVEVKLEVSPVGPPPELGYQGVRATLSADGRWLAVEVVVEALNGLNVGTISVNNRTAGMSHAERIWGTAQRGVYRVLLPWVERATGLTATAGISLFDRVGHESHIVESIDIEHSGIPKNGLIDEIGPELVGVTGGAREIEMRDVEQRVDLEFAIRDDGGSGFEVGEIFLPGEWNDFGVETRWRISFGPSQRIKGDSRLGVYRVEVIVPPFTPPGALRMQLRDRAGNLGGVWGDVRTSSWLLTGGRLDPLIPLPVVLVRETNGEVNLPELSKLQTGMSDGRLVTSASLSHPVGIYGGEVILLDALGVVVVGVGFTEANRVSGDAREGRYDVEIANLIQVPGGMYRVLWIAMGADGGRVQLLLEDEVRVPEREFLDEHRPALVTFEVKAVLIDPDLGTGMVEVALTAEDDRPGLVVEVIVLDDDLREIGRASRSTSEAFWGGEISVPFERIGTSGGGRVVLILTDDSGRREVYGVTGNRDWNGEEAELELFSDGLNELDRWSAQWLAENIFGHEEDDPDRDGWTNLLEFALGTDPLVHVVHDPLAGSLPKTKRMNKVVTEGELDQQLVTRFRPAPWFAVADGRVLGENYEIGVEGSGNLWSWDSVDFSEFSSDGGHSVEFLEGLEQTQSFRVHRLRVWATE